VALAAERASADDLAEIAEAYAAMAVADPAGDTAIEADLRSIGRSLLRGTTTCSCRGAI